MNAISRGAIHFYSLKNKNIVITGGSKGLGRMISQKISELGGNTIVISRNPENATPSMSTLSTLYPDQTHKSFQLDVGHLESVQQCFTQIEKECSKIDVLINCAGINVDSLLLRTNEKDMSRVMQTNLMGTIYCSKAVIRGMMKNNSGCIINIGSVIGSHGNVGQTIYSASKSGLIGFTKSLAKEVGSKGIRVNLLEPGFFETEMTSQIPEKQKQEIVNQITLKRFGKPEDLACAVEFLIQNQFLTGQVISVDGGMFL